ncbi:hypothetical protein BD408DRAFT_423150 [Parasitella parasitica]|nr:hypothetical protein BD408DRAFT_423150 [Parasitella parasitica]
MYYYQTLQSTSYHYYLFLSFSTSMFFACCAQMIYLFSTTYIHILLLSFVCHYH